MAACSRVILQCDWDITLRDDGGKAWVSFKVPDKPSIHGELVNQGLSTTRIPYVTGSEGFTVHEVTKKTITVSYSGDVDTCYRKFQAPQVTYSTIHRKSVACVDVTNGGLGVSCDSESKLRIWETTTGEVRRNLEGHVNGVYTCRFFPSGVVLLTGGSDMQLKIWSAETGQCAATMTGHKAGIQDTAIVDRGRNVVSCSRDGTARLWDCGRQLTLGTFAECGGILNACSLGVSENSISLGTPDYPQSEREVLTEGKMLLLACENKMLQAYGLQSRKRIFQLDCHDAVNCCTFLSETTAVCGTQDGHLTVVDLRKYNCPLKEWKECRSSILSLLPHQQGFFASTGDGSCFLVSSQFETILDLTGADCDPVYKIASDRTSLYAACRDGTVRKYRLTSC